MLRELNLPYERLPWYTLEKDLKKHGCTVVNWPAGVHRKHGNRGIHDLSAVEVNSLYEAITCPDESHRLRICRCLSSLTGIYGESHRYVYSLKSLLVVPVRPMNHTATAVVGSKRPADDLDLPSHPSKIIRFKDMTSKVSQQHLSDHGTSGT
ncbi:hypothetical protein EDD16DRAFT_1655622 [Pisolithus croceorrhizus]|nr:hypothetical protein EDD16DRAFT_1655622 [Pisolithus croceorrhizus]